MTGDDGTGWVWDEWAGSCGRGEVKGDNGWTGRAVGRDWTGRGGFGPGKEARDKMKGGDGTGWVEVPGCRSAGALPGSPAVSSVNLCVG